MARKEDKIKISFEELLRDDESVEFRAIIREDLNLRRQIARNAIVNIQRFLEGKKKKTTTGSLDLPQLMLSALEEVAADPLKAFYGPGNERILSSVKMQIKEFLHDVRSVALGGSRDALALAFTYEACELYEEACDLYRHIASKMDEKLKPAREGEQRVLEKLKSHRLFPE